MLFIRKDNMQHGQMSIQILLKQLYQYLNAHHRSLERNDLAWIDCCGYSVIMICIIAGFRIDMLGI